MLALFLLALCLTAANGDMAGMPGMAGMAGMHMGGGGGDAAAADSGAAKPPCVVDPTAKACATFQLPPATAAADLAALCKAMNFMVGCSVYKACRAAAPRPDAVAGAWTAQVASNPDACQPLNLVATICAHDTGMGGMAGCRADYSPMCAAGSVVPACKALPGLAELPTTKAANEAVKALCTEKRARPGCAPCLDAFDAGKTYGDCDLLSTWGDICAKEPKLPACANHTALCAKDKAWFFCSGAAAARTAQAPAAVAPAVGASSGSSKAAPAPAPAPSAAHAATASFSLLVALAGVLALVGLAA